MRLDFRCKDRLTKWKMLGYDKKLISEISNILNENSRKRNYDFRFVNMYKIFF